MTKRIQRSIFTICSLSAALVSSSAHAQEAHPFSIGLSLRAGNAAHVVGEPSNEASIATGVDLLGHWRRFSFGLSADYTRTVESLSHPDRGFAETHGALLVGVNLPITSALRLELLGEGGAHAFQKLRANGDPDRDQPGAVVPYLGARLGLTARTPGAVRFVVGLWTGLRQDLAHHDYETTDVHYESHLHQSRLINDLGVHLEQDAVYGYNRQTLGGTSVWAALSLGVEF